VEPQSPNVVGNADIEKTLEAFRGLLSIHSLVDVLPPEAREPMSRALFTAMENLATRGSPEAKESLRQLVRSTAIDHGLATETRDVDTKTPTPQPRAELSATATAKTSGFGRLEAAVEGLVRGLDALPRPEKAMTREGGWLDGGAPVQGAPAWVSGAHVLLNTDYRNLLPLSRELTEALSKPQFERRLRSLAFVQRELAGALWHLAGSDHRTGLPTHLEKATQLAQRFLVEVQGARRDLEGG